MTASPHAPRLFSASLSLGHFFKSLTLKFPFLWLKPLTNILIYTVHGEQQSFAANIYLKNIMSPLEFPPSHLRNHSFSHTPKVMAVFRLLIILVFFLQGSSNCSSSFLKCFAVPEVLLSRRQEVTDKGDLKTGSNETNKTSEQNK